MIRGGTRGQKQANGSWEIDGLNYAKVGEAGTGKFEALDFGPVIFRDVENLRQPLALNFHQIETSTDAENEIGTAWGHMGCDFWGSYHVTEFDQVEGDGNSEDILPETALQLDGELPPTFVAGDIIRCYDNRIWVARGATLLEIDAVTEELLAEHVISEAGSIVSLEIEAGLPIGLIETIADPPPEPPTYEQGELDGQNTGNWVGAADGNQDFVAGYGYHGSYYQPLQDILPFVLADFEASYGFDLNPSAWLDGFYSGFQLVYDAAYDTGFVDGGGTIP